MKIGLLTVTIAMCVSAATFAGNYTEENIDSYLDGIKAHHAAADQQRGLEIFTRQYLIDEGWRDMTAEMDMELIDATGRTSRRKIIKKMLEDEDKPDKTLGVFLHPVDVKGVVMLTHEQSYGPDEQWLYLSSQGRTKKINAENKSGSFMGTEFSWEDISTTELSKYTYRYLGEEGGEWMVERIPSYQYSGYSREVTWVDKANYQTVKVEFYDRKGDLLKTLTLGELQQYKGRYWRPSFFHMVNHQTKKETVLRMRNYTFGSDLDPQQFTSLGLRRVVASEVH